jgi:hypothetical protein
VPESIPGKVKKANSSAKLNVSSGLAVPCDDTKKASQKTITNEAPALFHKNLSLRFSKSKLSIEDFASETMASGQRFL